MSAEGGGAGRDPASFSREMEPFDYVMFRTEQDPRARSAMLSIALLDLTPDFGRVRTAFDRASRVALRLRQHVVVPVIPVSSPQWIIDPDFDLSFHVRRVRLPEPGTIRQLLDFAQPFLAAPFDTARPLWEALLVEGITEGDAPAAVLLKMHHTVTDGLGAVEMFRQLYDFERDVDRGPLPTLPAPEDLSSTEMVRSASRRAPISMLSLATRRTSETVRLWQRVSQDPARALKNLGRLAGSAQRVLGPPPVKASPLFRRRSLGRRLETLEFPLDRFRAAAKVAGGSVNDAYIAALGGALRRYHEELGVPVDALPLAMPVSLRTDDDPAGGNRFAGARIALPVGELDPARRVARIREQVLSAVAEPAINALNAVAPVVALLPSPMLASLAGIAAKTDVQASNVPGYPTAPFIAGAKVLKTLPFGPLPGVPMMIIMVTEAGMCYVGVHYDTAAVTHQDLFLRCLHEGFDEMLSMAPGESAAAPADTSPRKADKSPRKAPAKKRAPARPSSAPTSRKRAS